MIELIPLENYTKFFFYFTLLLILITWNKLNRSINLPISSPIALLSVFGLTLYCGLRPISGHYFGDMSTYARFFENYAMGAELSKGGDIGFNRFMQYCSQTMSVEMFFLLAAFIYVFLHYYTSKKLLGKYWYYGFLILIGSFSFWTYGTNGIRNGLAAAIMLFAFSFTNRKYLAIGLGLLAISFHKSMILPFAAYLFTFLNNDPKKYFKVWLLSIPLSLVLGGAFEAFFSALGIFEDDRLSYLTEGNVNEDKFSSTGFRWDFLIYSATAVFVGWYFIFKRKFDDVIYHRLFNVYLTANAFWILVIRANFSNRFAYLSWFMMGLVIIYPFLKEQMIPNRNRKLGWVMLSYFMFTFLMNVVLA